MKVKIFTQPKCPACPKAKELGAKLIEEGKKVEYYDIKTAEGLTEGILHDVMSTPSIIVVDKSGKEVASYRSTVPRLEEIKNHL